MKGIKNYIHHIIDKRMVKIHTIVTDTSGEGFVDTAVIS